MLERYFPWGVATGEAFLGRQDEIERLRANISKGYHTLLLSPRRYGKTSLAKQVVNLIGFPFVEIDLFVAQNEFSIEQKFIAAVQAIITQIDAPERWLNPLVNYFKKANKTWSVGIKGIKLEIKPENHRDIPENILEALNALEHILIKKKQRAVIFVDEFQEIANIKISKAIEGAIRHFAQECKQVVFIFSGSSRHMLQHMFANQSRPLYALCDEIHLTRLSPQDYKSYLNKIAKKTWGKGLTESVFEKIIQVTECHPRYMYILCSCLWDHCSHPQRSPELHDVEDTWKMIVNDKVKDIREMLSRRASGQIKILSLIAAGYHKEITSQLAQIKVNMSGSAITQSAKILIQEDYIEKTTEGLYRIIDPLLKTVLARSEDVVLTDHYEFSNN